MCECVSNIREYLSRPTRRNSEVEKPSDSHMAECTNYFFCVTSTFPMEIFLNCHIMCALYLNCIELNNCFVREYAIRLTQFFKMVD